MAISFANDIDRSKPTEIKLTGGEGQPCLSRDGDFELEVVSIDDPKESSNKNVYATVHAKVIGGEGDPDAGQVMRIPLTITGKQQKGKNKGQANVLTAVKYIASAVSSTESIDKAAAVAKMIVDSGGWDHDLVKRLMLGKRLYARFTAKPSDPAKTNGRVYWNSEAAWALTKDDYNKRVAQGTHKAPLPAAAQAFRVSGPQAAGAVAQTPVTPLQSGTAPAGSAPSGNSTEWLSKIGLK